MSFFLKYAQTNKKLVYTRILKTKINVVTTQILAPKKN
jgi:hypothetical protein